MSEKVKLEDIVAEMVASESRCSRVLSRGLVLGFTPQEGQGNKDGARFVWSRVDCHPSDEEDRIMMREIEKGMRLVKSMVVVGGPSFRTALGIRKGWGSSMLYWSWISTAGLMGLQGRKRSRALSWIDGD